MAKSAKDTAVDWRAERKKIIPFFIAQLILATVMTFVIMYGGYYYCPSIPVPKSNDFSEKLIYALRVCAFPAVMTLFLAVGMVSSKRGNGPALNPLSGNERHLQVDKNFLSNTVEQLLLFLLFVLVLITYLEPSEMRIIVFYSTTFVFSRIIFRTGYGVHPKYRSCGILMLFFTHSIIIGMTIYLMYTRGFMYNLPTISFGSNEASQSAGKTEL